MQQRQVKMSLFWSGLSLYAAHIPAYFHIFKEMKLRICGQQI